MTMVASDAAVHQSIIPPEQSDLLFAFNLTVPEIVPGADSKVTDVIEAI